MTKNTNKEEMGMNRNDFYEYKKNRVIEMVKSGASVTDMAEDMGMGEKDMYAFLSRNFGGIRRLKEMVKNGGEIPQLQMASMETEQSEVVEKKQSGGKNGNKRGKKKKSHDKPVSIMDAFNSALSTEKAKLLDEFKRSIEQDSKAIIAEAQKSMVKMKEDLINGFKNDIMNSLSLNGRK